jgi:RNA polymerase sigma-70 factor (ECF subfamily)
MPWETAIPNTLAGDPSVAACQPNKSAGGVMDSADSQMSSACGLMNNDAFAAFYERSARPLWAYLARVSGDPALADDLMQESFVRFLCAAHPADGEVASRRYLFRIATNLLRDHWRKRRTTAIDDIPEVLFATASAAAQSDTQAMLGPAMAQLRPRDRQLLWLAYAEGYSHREIAEVTGLASTSIRLLLLRARRKAASLLRKEPTNTGGTQ